MRKLLNQILGLVLFAVLSPCHAQCADVFELEMGLRPGVAAVWIQPTEHPRNATLPFTWTITDHDLTMVVRLKRVEHQHLAVEFERKVGNGTTILQSEFAMPEGSTKEMLHLSANEKNGDVWALSVKPTCSRTRI